MPSIAEFTLPVGEFPLGRLFETHPDATLDLDRVVPSGDTVMPYFWVHDEGADMAAVRRVLDNVPELRTTALMEDLGDNGLFRAEWKPEFMGIMRAIDETGLTVLSASGSADGWIFELRADQAGTFADFRQQCRELELPVTLARLGQVSDVTGEPAPTAVLTPEQREALCLAFEEGYYDRPRRTDLEELAAELDISRQAFSDRLRRGYRNVIAATIADESENRRPP